MKRSIQYKFTATLLGIVAITLLAIYVINTFGLESYYVNEKTKAIRLAYSSIDEILEDTVMSTEESSASGYINDKELIEKLSAVLKQYSDKYNISIALIDSLDDTAIISSERDGELILRRAQDSIFSREGNVNIDRLYEGDNYIISRHSMNDDSSSFIECVGYCSDDRTLVLMSTPMETVRNSVDLSNQFLMYIALGAFTLSIVIAFFMSKRITKPILRLADISEKICSLDFAAKYTDNYEDEIGVLGHNINQMSDKLKSTIEELKSANESLREDIRRKEEIDEMRKSFIANVSHELKTPIALIQGYAEGLSEGLCEDEESRNYYTEVIIDEANKMNAMVRQLLDLSVLESGSTVLQKERFNIYELIDGVLSSTKILVADKDIDIELIGDKETYIYADEFKIEEVVTNYISNAIKHIYDKGLLSISIIKLKDSIRVEVFNTGAHIPPEDIERIWDKFYKVDKAHSRDYGGTGIGLSIVKAILDLHNMDYGVENVEEGVVFYFETKTESS